MVNMEKSSKERLLETALSLIWVSGYACVSVDEICRRTDIRKGSLYHYFPSKSDLAVAALIYHWRGIQPTLDHIFSPQVPGIDRLANFCEYTYTTQLEKAAEFGRVCGCVFTSIGSEQCGHNEQLRHAAIEIMQRHKKYLEFAIKGAREEGVINVKDIGTKVDELFAYYLGVLTLARISNDAELLTGLKKTFFGLLGLDNGT